MIYDLNDAQPGINVQLGVIEWSSIVFALVVPYLQKSLNFLQRAMILQQVEESKENLWSSISSFVQPSVILCPLN